MLDLCFVVKIVMQHTIRALMFLLLMFLYRIILLLLFVCFCENFNISKKSFHICYVLQQCLSGFFFFMPFTFKFLHFFFIHCLKIYQNFFFITFLICIFEIPFFLLPKNFNYEICPCICVLGIAFEMCGVVEYVMRSITFQYNRIQLN